MSDTHGEEMAHWGSLEELSYNDRFEYVVLVMKIKKQMYRQPALIRMSTRSVSLGITRPADRVSINLAASSLD